MSVTTKKLKSLRSVRSTERSYVRFKNETSSKVVPLWIDYNGYRRRFRELSPGETSDVDTYVSHPWIFENRDSGDWLLGDFQQTYYPVNWNSVFQSCNFEMPVRKIVHITYPVYSLKERCLQVLRDSLLQIDDVDTLELPITVMKDLKKVFVKKSCLSKHDLNCTQCSWNSKSEVS